MNEANWTFEVCYRLRNEGVPFELELTLPAGRVDIAIIEGSFLYGVIEVKKREKLLHNQRNFWAFQFKRYASMGVPFHHTHPQDNLEALVNKCKSWAQERGRTIDEVWEDSRVIRKPKRIRPVINQEWDCQNC